MCFWEFWTSLVNWAHRSSETELWAAWCFHCASQLPWSFAELWVCTNLPRIFCPPPASPASDYFAVALVWYLSRCRGRLNPAGVWGVSAQTDPIFSVLNTIHGYLKPSCKFHKRWTISKTSAAVSGQEHYRPELHSCDALRESPPLEANGILEALPGTSQIYSAGRTPQVPSAASHVQRGRLRMRNFHVPAVSSCAVLISLEAMFWYSMIFHCHGNTWQQEETFLQKVW